MSDVTPPPAPQSAPNPYAAPAAPNSYASAPTPYTSLAVGPKINTLSIVALVLSILWISLPAVICGHIAMSQIKTRREGGNGLAIASLIIGYVGILLGVLVAVILVLPLIIVSATGGFSG